MVPFGNCTWADKFYKSFTLVCVLLLNKYPDLLTGQVEKTSSVVILLKIYHQLQWLFVCEWCPPYIAKTLQKTENVENMCTMSRSILIRGQRVLDFTINKEQGAAKVPRDQDVLCRLQHNKHWYNPLLWAHLGGSVSKISALPRHRDHPIRACAFNWTG